MTFDLFNPAPEPDPKPQDETLINGEPWWKYGWTPAVGAEAFVCEAGGCEVCVKCEALKRVEDNANEDWKQSVMLVIQQLAETKSEFTTDEIWERMSTMIVSTHEPRALGALIRKAASKGWIQNTGRYVPSKRIDCHSRPIPVWKSLVKDGT